VRSAAGETRADAGAAGARASADAGARTDRRSYAEALERLSDVVARASDVRPALRAINREVLAASGLRCERLSLGDPGVAGLLGLEDADDAERALLQRWLRTPGPAPHHAGGRTALPVLLRGRPAGVLWFSPGALDPDARALAGAIATALGEVAQKSKLRREALRYERSLAIAADRQRIARDLHETVGQTLYAIGLRTQELLSRTRDPEILPSLRALRTLAASGVATVRSAVFELSFLNVRERGFVPSLHKLARQFKLATGTPVTVRVPGSLPHVPSEVEGILFRLAHEALINVERHARATGVLLMLEHDEGEFRMTIRDDGIGIDQRNAFDWRSSAHFGLRSIRRSVEALGGRLSIAAAHPRGLTISARISVNAARSAVQ